MKIHGEGERDEGQFPRPLRVTYIDGAVMFARTDFWRRLGGFREEFFMYVEAVELCAKVAKMGKALTLVPQAKVYHFEPPPGANSSAEFAFHRYKNFFALYLLHARARRLPEFFARYAGLGLPRAAANGSLRPFLRALGWTARRAPSLLRERMNGRRAADAPPPRVSEAERLSFNDE
jgi:GT2 family glycosyltransferase